jgi:ketosteroid isomerase-like protein
MASKNVETLRAAHESWNKRNFPGVVKNAAEGLVYTDNARAITLNSRHKFREWTEEWAKAFSDGRITNPEYTDAGDTVVARFTVVGTNDGSFGSMKLWFIKTSCIREMRDLRSERYQRLG